MSFLAIFLHAISKHWNICFKGCKLWAKILIISLHLKWIYKFKFSYHLGKSNLIWASWFCAYSPGLASEVDYLNHTLAFFVFFRLIYVQEFTIVCIFSSQVIYRNRENYSLSWITSNTQKQSDSKKKTFKGRKRQNLNFFFQIMTSFIILKFWWR